MNPHTFRNVLYVYVGILTPVLSHISYSPNLPSLASKCDAPAHIYRPEGNRQSSRGRKIIEVGSDLTSP